MQFSYPSREDVKVLKGISFTLDPDRKRVIALCGMSGSGKSTTVSLIKRFYDPAHGRVLFNGKDIRDLDLSWYS